MASSAISAQGTVVSIGTGTGGAKTATAIALGFPTILTSAAHGFSNGYVASLAGFTGADAALLNGQTVVITNVTTNTYAVQIDTTGKTITVGAGAATPVTFTAIANIKDFSGFDGGASEIDVTNLASTAKEFRLGLVDNGQFSINIDYADTDAGQQAAQAKHKSGASANFQVVFPNADTVTFVGYVKKFSAAAGVDGVVKSSIDVRISGAVTGLAE
jgi:hypothetical protein